MPGKSGIHLAWLLVGLVGLICFAWWLSERSSGGEGGGEEKRSLGAAKMNSEAATPQTWDWSLPVAPIPPPETSALGPHGDQSVNSIPKEWEEPLMTILLDPRGSPQERCLKLIDLATRKAKGVPVVQRECLKHLIYSLQDNDWNSFLFLSTNSAIPLPLRIQFVQEVTGIRPDDLSEWLCANLSQSPEAALAGFAKGYLEARKAEQAQEARGQ